MSRRNGERNGITRIDYRLADWTDWRDETRYHWILGADVLYAELMHPHLRRIFRTNLAQGGTVLLADPFRTTSWPLLEGLQVEGWNVMVNRWNLGDGVGSRVVGVFELALP